MWLPFVTWLPCIVWLPIRIRATTQGRPLYIELGVKYLALRKSTHATGKGNLSRP